MESSRAAAGRDHISGLSDELLVTILAGLHSAAEAARTSVLSRRWRRVWTTIPDLIFLDDSTSPDAALDSYSALTMDRFVVGLGDMSRPVSAARAATWLRFAAEHAAREVHVLLPCKQPPPLPEYDVEEELEVPVLERTLWLNATFVYCFRLRLPPAGAGVFAALRTLSITLGRVSGGDLSRVVFSQCPCLVALDLAMLDVDGDVVSIRSNTLERLALRVVGVEKNRLDVAAPRLEFLRVHGCGYAEARIAAPILTEVEWDDDYDPARHLFTETGRRLDRLAVTQWSPPMPPPLLDRFDAADELSLHLRIPPLPIAYLTFLENTKKLPNFKALAVGLQVIAHPIESCLLHLLRQCVSITKLEIELIHHNLPKVPFCKLFGCPCVKPEMLRTDNVALDLLEVVEFHFFTGSDEDVDLVKLLFMCKNTLKKMVINVAYDVTVSDEVHEKIKRFSHPSTTLEIGGLSSHKRDVYQCK